MRCGFVLVGGRRKTKASKMELRESVKFSGSVVRRIELAEQDREYGDVRQVLEAHSVEREVVREIVDAMRGNFMKEATLWRGLIKVPRCFGGCIRDVIELEQR